VIRYLITDGAAAADEARWLKHLWQWLDIGMVDLLQIRERELTARRLAELVRKVLQLPNPWQTKILVNDRTDIAIACGADGVHLRDGALLPAKIRALTTSPFIVSAACHSAGDVRTLAGADYILLAPIFAPLSKSTDRPPLGLEAIYAAAQLTSVPLIALGGITASNAHTCVEAGAAGVAGISLFN
jgi:thiamine-phosphate pyrophosphorylase